MKQATWILLFLLPLFCFGQTNSIQKSPPLSVASAESVGISSERLARIDAVCQNAISTGAIPGGVALVAKEGKINYNISKNSSREISLAPKLAK